MSGGSPRAWESGPKRKPPGYAGELVSRAKRVHPFPSRTRKLSSSAPMILCGQLHGKIGPCHLTRLSQAVFLYAFFILNPIFLQFLLYIIEITLDKVVFSTCLVTLLLNQHRTRDFSKTFGCYVYRGMFGHSTSSFMHLINNRYRKLL